MVSSFIHIYADDTKISCNVASDIESDALQKDFIELVNWSRTWQLCFNVNKCKVMHIGNHTKKHVYVMHDYHTVYLDGVNEEFDFRIMA